MTENDIIAEYVKSRFPNIISTADFALYRIGIGLKKTIENMCDGLSGIDWERVRECLESVNEQQGIDTWKQQTMKRFERVE